MPDERLRIIVAPGRARRKATGTPVPATATFRPDSEITRTHDLMNARGY